MNLLITVTGISYYISSIELEPHQEIILKKDPTNKYDKEAIAVYINDTMQIGYVANSIHTVAKGTYSSGRLYDKMGETITATIIVIIKDSAIASLTVD
ncbi:HIRAN domain-containing protein [Allocoprobacillus halotolerans]|uniref:HIRAN domain-containing protein n=1 Tax=Allocoprobacillus halotolerans TaxID=2944914 RepID=A0ABY5I5L9_9FIRM|nr:HIRAN domain-containing protein [Allocoprobacillus halotolerans]UTY39242.1 HIRAN domain-containing protein [Allocoprobacillus halotolerans]